MVNQLKMQAARSADDQSTAEADTPDVGHLDAIEVTAQSPATAHRQGCTVLQNTAYISDCARGGAYTVARQAYRIPSGDSDV